MEVDGITILELARDGELKPKTILRTKHEKQYFDDRDYDYYIYFGDKQFHRCDENGKLGAKYQTRFLNYEVLNKEFELILPKEDEEEFEDIEEIKMIGCNVKINILNKESNFGTDTPIVTEHCISKINQLIRNQKKLIYEVNKLKRSEK